MLPEMDVAAVLTSLIEAFERDGIRYALIGGLALAPHGAGRGTQDVDMLVDGDQSDAVDRILRDSGYDCLLRTIDVGNYASVDPEKGRVDFLFAVREGTRGMLERAKPHRALTREDVRVVEPEDLIGLKVQAYSNDPRRRHADLADVQRLIRANPELDLGRVREYFVLFDREKELDDLLGELQSK
jgi:hypothetical protein